MGMLVKRFETVAVCSQRPRAIRMKPARGAVRHLLELHLSMHCLEAHAAVRPNIPDMHSARSTGFSSLRSAPW
jgi:hypothetical protein